MECGHCQHRCNGLVIMRQFKYGFECLNDAECHVHSMPFILCGFQRRKMIDTFEVLLEARATRHLERRTL